MSKRTRKNVMLGKGLASGTTIEIGEEVEDQVISQGGSGDGFPIDGEGMRGRVDVLLGEVTKGSGVTFKFQAAACKNSDGDWVWQDIASGSVPADSTDDTVVSILYNPHISGLEDVLPVGLVGQVCCSTDTGADVVVKAIYFTESYL